MKINHKSSSCHCMTGELKSYDPLNFVNDPKFSNMGSSMTLKNVKVTDTLFCHLQHKHDGLFLLDLILYVPVNNFSGLSGRVFLG